MRKQKRKKNRRKVNRGLRIESLEKRIALAVTPGDFSLDNGVDNVDLQIWQSAYGVNDLGDANGDGQSNGLDFLIWQANYGMPSGVCPPDPTPENVTVLLDTHFTTADGYLVGNLQFQEPDGSGNGIWLGQTASQVDPSGTGTVSAAGGIFERNMWSLGANGSSPGDAFSSNGFLAGDQLRLTFDYQFDLSGDINTPLANVGFRDDGPNAGNNFETAPQQGWDSDFNVFGDFGGSVKFFPDMADTNNADALIIDGNDLGIDPGNDLGQGADFSSDNLQITYLTTYLGAGNWSVDSFSVENLDTSTTFDYSGPTQTFEYYTSESGAPAMTPASDAFFSKKLANNGDASFTGTMDAAKYELIEVIPEVNTILDTDYTAAEGFVDGELQFQQGWLGQTGTIVDSTGTGTVTTDIDGAGSGGFLRNSFGAGATGGTGGVASTADFNNGDQLRITLDYQFTLGSNGTTNLAIAGFRDEGPNLGNGFENNPQQGFKINYNTFEATSGGSVKFFPDLADSDNADALIIDGTELGLDAAGEFGAADFTSDNLQITYLVSTDGADNWTVDSLTVENLDTSTTFEYTGPTQTFTFAGTDAFYGQSLAFANQPNLVATSDAVKFEYLTPPAPPLVTLSTPLDTDFTLADGYIDGELATPNFQQGWLGQTGFTVDADGSGTVTVDSSTDGFKRAVNGVGATGGTGGVPSVADFNNNDFLRITLDYQFTLAANATTKTVFAGIRDEGPNVGNGFESNPQQGFDGEYNQFGAGVGVEPDTGGTVKFWPDLTDTLNADALLIDGYDLGLDPNDSLGGGADLVSDNLQITYLVSTDGADNWTVESFSVENLDTSTTFDYAGPTQTFVFAGTDAFFAFQLTNAGASPGLLGTTDAVKFEYLSQPGATPLVLNGGEQQEAPVEVAAASTAPAPVASENVAVHTEVAAAPLVAPEVAAPTSTEASSALDLVGIAQFVEANAGQVDEEDSTVVDPAFASIALEAVFTSPQVESGAGADAASLELADVEEQDEEAVDEALAEFGSGLALAL